MKIKTKSVLNLLSIILIFSLALILPMFWVELRLKTRSKTQRIKAMNILSNYNYQPINPGKNTEIILETTNILNGHFFDYRSNRYSVFHAIWEKGEGLGGNVLAHSPDMCWIGAGFQPLNIGSPTIVSLEFNKIYIECECRVMLLPDKESREIAIWFATVDGSFYPPIGKQNGDKNQLAPHQKQIFDNLFNPILNRCLQFTHLLLDPISINSEKQYFRISKRFDGDWNDEIQEVQKFAQDWIVIDKSF